MRLFPTYIWDKILWGRIKNEQNFCIRGGEANIFKDFYLLFKSRIIELEKAVWTSLIILKFSNS